MEFSYRISEEDYLKAHKLANKLLFKKLKTSISHKIVFWSFVVICCVLLYGVVRQVHDRPSAAKVESTRQIIVPTADSIEAVLMNWGPIVVILAIWMYVWIVSVPKRVRKLYRSDPNLQGFITLKLDDSVVEIQNSVGSTARSGWNVFKDWREGAGFFLVRYPSGGFLIIPTSGFSEVEQVQLRNVLTASLPTA